MTPEGWRRAGELFHQALELSSGDRTSWMEGACNGDPELRRELSALLESDRAAHDFVKDQVKAGVVALHADDVRARTPRRVGPYWIVRELGRGGMGTVYLAQRDDDQYNIEVAIKLVTPGMDTEFVLQRFRRERQTLADLQHPNIARLLDGGTTEDGLPYIVMEYIEGLWITEYCQTQDLSIEQRLRVFLDVCAAAEHAHRSFVVHRDIKPGNILVNSSGVPKLLDFGICKLLYADPLMAGQTIAESSRMLTPDYASPEQIRGDPVTIASDVYSLGAVLYEILTETKAHRFENYSLQEIERVICDLETIPPSAALADRAVSRRLTGDLDVILLHALQKDPLRRYGTVENFSDDIRRHLSHVPVRARSDTVLYRVSKFVRRRTGTVIASALALTALLAGVAVSTYQAHRANRRFEQVRALANSMIFDLSESIQDVPGTTEARAKLVNAALPYLNSLAADSGNDPGLLWELGRAYEKIGDLQGQPGRPNLGRPPDALNSYRKAIRILEQIPSDEPRVTQSLIETHLSAGLLETRMGPSANALHDYNTALRLAQDLLVASPADEERQRLLASSYNRIGDAQLTARDPHAALRSFQAGLEAFGGRDPSSAGARRTLGIVYGRIGEALEETGPIPKAVENLRHATAIREELLRRNPASLESQRDVFVAYINLGNALGGARGITLGDTAGAAESYRQALAMAQELAKRDVKNARAREDLAFGYHKMGEVTEVSDPRASVQWFRQALSITEELLKPSPRDAEHRRLEAERRTGLAEALYQAGEHTSARAEFERAQQTWRELADADPLRVDLQQDLLASYCQLCGLHTEMKDTGPALENRNRALAMIARVEANRSSFYALRGLANCYEAFGEWDAKREHWDEARSWYRKSLEVWNEWQSRGAGDQPSLQRLARVKRLLTAVEAKQ